MNRLFYSRTLAVIIFCLLAVTASAYDFVEDGIYYTANGTDATVTYKDGNYNSYSGTVNIPVRYCANPWKTGRFLSVVPNTAWNIPARSC